MEDNSETLWEFEDAMRFESPATYAIVHHDDGDITLEGGACHAEISDDWMSDTKRRIAALNRAGLSTSWGNAHIRRMQQALTEDELRAAFERFEAQLDWEMMKLLEMLDDLADDDELQ